MCIVCIGDESDSVPDVVLEAHKTIYKNLCAMKVLVLGNDDDDDVEVNMDHAKELAHENLLASDLFERLTLSVLNFTRTGVCVCVCASVVFLGSDVEVLYCVSTQFFR